MKTIKTKLFFAFIAIIVVMMGVNCLYAIINWKITARFKNISDNLISIRNISDYTSDLSQAFYYAAIDIKSRGKKANYDNINNALNNTVTSLNTKLVYDDSNVLWRGIKNIIAGMQQMTEDGFRNVLNGDVSTTSEIYYALNDRSYFMKENIALLIMHELKYLKQTQKHLYDIQRTGALVSGLLLICATGVCIIYSILISGKLVKPLEQLSRISSDVADGNLEVTVESSLLKNQDETGVLSNAFNAMVINLKSKIDEIQHTRLTVEDANSRLEAAKLELENTNKNLVDEILERKQAETELRDSEEKLRTLFETANDAILILDNARFVECNQKTLDMFGCTLEEIIGKTPFDFSPQTQAGGVVSEIYGQERLKKALEGEMQVFEWVHERRNGKIFFAEVSLNAMEIKGKQYLQAIVHDVTERKKAEEERLRLEKDLSQARKLESIGTLAAGIAHEINTPIQFIGDNVRFVNDSIETLFEVIKKHRESLTSCAKESNNEEVIRRGIECEQKADIDYLKKEMPGAIEQILDGIERVSKIVNAMKDYSHIGKTEKMAANLNKAIDSTVIISRNEWKYDADLTTEFDETLPPVDCYLAELNQVVMNIIINATHAIQDYIQAGKIKRGSIVVKTYRSGDKAVISVEDNGGGIPQKIKNKIFDPFFTTKAIGKGTGQGLSLAYNTIVDQHKGKLYFKSSEGVGTTFFIELPIASA